jgi:hypothetical protein
MEAAALGTMAISDTGYLAHDLVPHSTAEASAGVVGFGHRETLLSI